jgi:hypothetical protein
MEGEVGRPIDPGRERLMLSLKLVFSVFAVPCWIYAQAWLNPRDQGTVSVLYQYGFDRYHVMSGGEEVDRGHTSLQALMLDVDYSLTDRLAVRMAVPFILGKYNGGEPHLRVRGQPGTVVAIDDGRYHGGLQDFRFDIRYNVSRQKLMVTPFFQAGVPSNDYATLGHGAVGTNQREYRMGVNLGRQMNPWLPKAFLQGRYAFGMVQQIANVAPKRSYAELQLGYVVTRRLSLQASMVWAHSHNGIDFVNSVFPANLTDAQYQNHDRISRVNLLDVGGSASFGVTRKTSLFVGWGRSITGANTHLRGIVLTAGVTRSFTARSRQDKTSVMPSAEARKTLVCTCAKK